MTYRLQPASDVSLTQLVKAINLAYRNYFVPVSLTLSSFSALIQRDAIDLEASVVAEDNGAVVATALLAIRLPYGWVGGVGVVPSHRRRGIAHDMMDYLIDRAQERGLHSIQLEVIEANQIAHHLYLQLEFKPRRRLLMLERPPGDIQAEPGYYVGSCLAQTALRYYDQFHDVQPPWQRSREALSDLAFNMQGWKAVAAHEPDTILGYSVGWLTGDQFRMMDMGTLPEHTDRQGVGRALLAYIHGHHPHAIGNIFNLAQNDTALLSIQAMGYEETMGQVEMVLEI